MPAGLSQADAAPVIDSYGDWAARRGQREKDSPGFEGAGESSSDAQAVVNKDIGNEDVL